MVIYKAEFPNKKVYIGKTKNFEIRKNKHYYSIRYNKKTKMIRAIIKYGFENINWEIIFETQDETLLNNKEIELIKEYDSIKNGYNTAIGGLGGDTISFNENKNEIVKKQLSTKGKDINKYIIIDDELKIEIIKDYTFNNFSITKIANKYKINKKRINKLLLKEKIIINSKKTKETNSKKLSKDQIQNIISLYKEGLSINSISKLEKITIMLISRTLHEEKIRISKRFL